MFASAIFFPAPLVMKNLALDLQLLAALTDNNHVPDLDLPLSTISSNYQCTS
jgi:hypothetical protein